MVKPWTPSKKPYDGKTLNPMHPAPGTPVEDVEDFWGDTKALEDFRRRHGRTEES